MNECKDCNACVLSTRCARGVIIRLQASDSSLYKRINKAVEGFVDDGIYNGLCCVIEDAYDSGDVSNGDSIVADAVIIGAIIGYRMRRVDDSLIKQRLQALRAGWRAPD